MIELDRLGQLDGAEQEKCRIYAHAVTILRSAMVQDAHSSKRKVCGVLVDCICILTLVVIG